MFEPYEISDEDDPYFIPDWCDVEEEDAIDNWPAMLLDESALLWEPAIADESETAE